MNDYRYANVAGVRKELERKVALKIAENREMEMRIKENEGYIQAATEALNMYPQGEKSE